MSSIYELSMQKGTAPNTYLTNKFDVDIFAKWIAEINPDFINLGADSKGHNLPEPTVEKIMQLVKKLKKYGVELREKHNLQRLKP